jgi:hypothetical protein
LIDFKIEQILSDDAITYTLSGYIDEKSVFPLANKKPKIFINLTDVKGLNSVGTRSWCLWVKQMPPPSVVYLEECPLLFVKSFNQVSGCLTPNMVVNSFVVPYYSESNNERKRVVFMKDVEFDKNGTIKFPQIVDSQGNEMIPDVLDQYFNFLKR